MYQHHSQRHLAVLTLTAAAIGLMAACASEPESPTAAVEPSAAHTAHARVNNGELTAAQKQAIAEVRNATARFHDALVSRQAGYDVQFPAGCAKSPNAGEGAQAFHFLNGSLVDANVELLRPELLMYEPQRNGSLQLVGVDYVVPLAASEEPPTLLGVPFMAIEELGVWALHIWAWRPNPSGMFATWNPKVSCAYEQAYQQ
jgi:hypothetical protein